jgi:alkaline phosphatase D
MHTRYSLPTPQQAIVRFAFVFLTLLLPACAGAPIEPGPALTHGPVLGRVTPTSAIIWARGNGEGHWTVVVVPTDRGARRTAQATVTQDADLCASATVTGLLPDTHYTYTIHSSPPVSGTFKTPAPDATPSCVTLAIGSCAKEDAGTAACWERLQQIKPDALLLLGDTPYIDTTKLDVQRRRYQEFAAVPSFAALVRNCPLYSTWDDHDFGKNDTNGVLKGKENSLRAFREYHPGASTFGNSEGGLYTSFRHGPIEVFLLDTRWFAGTEPSPFDASKKSLLGKRQWEWLHQRLTQSTAPFKLIACGMIWNDAVRPGKTDYWGAYPWERDALFQFIGENKIANCVLIGGDIHRSRVIRHQSTSLAGYDLVELISSPMHNGIIQTANVPHPGLIKDMGEPHTFLVVTADSMVTPPTLVATFMNGDGQTHFEMRVLPSTQE